MSFYGGKGVDCAVVEEQSCLVVTLCSDCKTHEFRYGRKAFAGAHKAGIFQRVLEREYAELLAGAGPFPPGRHPAYTAANFYFAR